MSDYQTNEVRIYQVSDEDIKNIDKLRLASAVGNHVPTQSNYCRKLLRYAIKLELKKLKQKKNHVTRKPRVELRKQKAGIETGKG